MKYSYRVASPKKGTLDILGLPVHPIRSLASVHAYLQKVISRNEKALILNLNIHAIIMSMKHRWYFEFMQHAGLMLCDGDGVRWGLRILGSAPPTKVAITRWIWKLAAFCAVKKYTLFFLGASPEIAEKAVRKLKATYPELEVAGYHHGYFKHEGEENEAVIAKINRLKPHVLMVCMGMPLQEKWMMQNWQRLHVNIFANGGGVLDYVSGRLGRVPEWMLKLHLEWLFRVWQEPRRLFWRYAHDIPLFFYYIFREKIRRSSIWRRCRKSRPGSS